MVVVVSDNFCHVEITGVGFPDPPVPARAPFLTVYYEKERYCPSWTTVACIPGYVPGYDDPNVTMTIDEGKASCNR